LRGSAAKTAMAQEDAMADQKKERAIWRWLMKPDEEGSCTFLDGDLDAEGIISAPLYYEHTCPAGGTWMSFPCLSHDGNCPACDGGDRPSLVGLFTVIDHRVRVSKDGTKEFKDTKKIFVSKRRTLKVLQKMAEKYGTLAGARFDISRTGPKEPAVGSVFIPVDRSTIEELTEKYGIEAVVVDYDEYVKSMYRTSDELEKLGFGTSEVIGRAVNTKNLDEAF